MVNLCKSLKKNGRCRVQKTYCCFTPNRFSVCPDVTSESKSKKRRRKK